MCLGTPQSAVLCGRLPGARGQSQHVLKDTAAAQLLHSPVHANYGLKHALNLHVANATQGLSNCPCQHQGAEHTAQGSLGDCLSQAVRQRRAEQGNQPQWQPTCVPMGGQQQRVGDSDRQQTGSSIVSLHGSKPTCIGAGRPAAALCSRPCRSLVATLQAQAGVAGMKCTQPGWAAAE